MCCQTARLDSLGFTHKGGGRRWGATCVSPHSFTSSSGMDRPARGVTHPANVAGGDHSAGVVTQDLARCDGRRFLVLAERVGAGFHLYHPELRKPVKWHPGITSFSLGAPVGVRDGDCRPHPAQGRANLTNGGPQNLANHTDRAVWGLG